MELQTKFIFDTPIILASINRPNYLDRILSYYQKHNYDQCLIIADGSEQKWPGATSFKGRYLHLPRLSFRERLIEGLEKSQSDLAVLCADDDFLIPSGLEKCIKFALDNPKYSCVHGQYGRFVINDDKINYTQKYAGLNSITDNDPLVRIKKVFIPKYIPHVYAVHRRKNIERVLNFKEMNEFEYLFNFEMLLTFSSLIDGKAKRLTHIYNFREMENTKVGINVNQLNVKKIESALNACKLHLKLLVDDLTNKDDFSDTIDSTIENLLKYHLSHCDQDIIKKLTNEKILNVLQHYRTKLRSSLSWLKKISPFSQDSSAFFSPNIVKNFFALNDEYTRKELEIIDETLKIWTKNKNTNMPES